MECTFRLITLVLGLAVVLPASAQIYQWKDKDGRMHYSDMPPPNQPGIQTQTPKRIQPPVTMQDEGEAETGEGGAEPTAATTPAQGKSRTKHLSEDYRKRRAATEAREKAEKDAARAAQNCQRARAQYAVLTSGRRISLPTETGGRKFLNDEERAAETERARELIEAFCSKD